MRKTLVAIAAAAAVAVGGGLLFGVDPKETFLFVVGLFGA